MRALALIGAIVFSLCVYPIFPGLPARLDALILRAYGGMQNIFEQKKADPRYALPALTALFCLAGTLIAELYAALSVVAMAPLFTFSAIMPACIAAKEELDSGKYSRDIPAYEFRVRESCQTIAPAFLRGSIAPLLLLLIGTPLYIGCTLGYAYFVLCALEHTDARAKRIIAPVNRAADAIFSAMLVLCAGLVGRNPLRIRAKDAQQRLIRTLGIAGDGTDTHAPMSGDIAQGIFVACFASGLFGLIVTLILAAVC